MSAHFHAPPPPGVELLRITVDQYRKMLETGIIREGAPYELLDGLVMLKDRSAHGEDIMTVGKRHRIRIQNLVDLNHALRLHGCHMQVQNPIQLDNDQMPEPDGAIVKGDPADCTDDHFGAESVVCVIEVSDSSLIHDLTTKLRIYATYALPQYVVVNVPDNQVEVYEEPDAPAKAYRKRMVMKGREPVPFNVGQGTRFEVPAEQLLK